MKENPMREIKIDKVTLNIGCGDDKDKMEKASELLKYLTERKPILTKSKRRSTFGIPKGNPIGVMVTLRGAKALEFFKRSLEAVEKKMKSSQLDDEGNFSLGIREYIDIGGAKYQHTVGMLGLNVTVTLQRAGFRIKRRRIQQRKIPVKHKINKEEVVNWLKNNFGVDVVE